ncbi:Uncharacterised protein [uncultured archaeon]|nr:Uncharacterised protein [uncultured archaeon]
MIGILFIGASFLPNITGKIQGEVSTSYNYTIQTIDPKQDPVRYYIDWSDNTNINAGLNASGEEIILSNTWWDSKGMYIIRVKAIDAYDAESDWATLEVKMPYSYSKPIPPFLKELFQGFLNAFPLLRHIFEYLKIFIYSLSFFIFNSHRTHDLKPSQYF